MNSKDLYLIVIEKSDKNKWAYDRLFPYNSPKNRHLFTKVIDLYSSRVGVEIAVLTGISDLEEIERITVSVFIRIWEARLEETKGMRPGKFVYELLLQEVFRYLRNKDDNSRVFFLQDCLKIDPKHSKPTSYSGGQFGNPTNYFKLN